MKVYLFRANGTIGLVNVNNKTCSCAFFHDKAICKHLVAGFIIKKVNIPGVVEGNTLPRSFIILRRRMKKARDQENSIIEPPNVMQHVESEVREDQVGEGEVKEVGEGVQKKRRGRPPKATKALENEASQISTSKKNTKNQASQINTRSRRIK